MKTAGIICEYNPFHLGHARQFRLIREALGEETPIVCIMSGNYVQRGTPAMWDKYTRAAIAEACGADVVLELPVTSVLQSAEGFARGGVEILDRFGVDYLSFGAECGNGSQLMQFADIMESPEYTQRLQEALKQGLPYAAARQQALDDPDNILASPNNILGVEYCRAIRSSGSALTPLVIHRNGDYHARTPDQEAPSATAIRACFPHGDWRKYMPEAASHLIQDKPWYDISFGERAVLARLRSLTEEEWRNCAHGSEGLWSKAMKASRSSGSFEEIIETTKSKRYPRTRIQRLLQCAYLGITQQDLIQPLPYARILAFSERGRPLIRSAKKANQLALVNPGETPAQRSYYDMEIRTSDLYTLFAAPGFSPFCRMEQSARIF